MKIEDQTQQQPQTLNNLGNPVQKPSLGRRFARFIGYLALTAALVILVLDLGIAINGVAGNGGIMSNSMLWVVTISLGMIAGPLIFPRKILAASIAGGITTVVFKVLVTLYVSWRSEFYLVEILIPFFIAAIVGLVVLVFFGGKPK